MPSEFQLIERYFTRPEDRADVALGVGDDAALLRPPPGQALVVTVDTLVAGVHFPVGTPPEAVGHKALAVNLSDLAAMGAEPLWVTLALTLPEADEAWIAAFSRGFGALLDAHGIALVGGDTTRGPLSITVQAMGCVPERQALRRDGARPGDDIYVTGTLGDAGLGLAVLQGRVTLDAREAAFCRDRLDRPVPRVEAGLALRGLAHAAIDVSDGLLADLGHVLDQSGVGASIALQALPLSLAMSRYLQRSDDWRLPLSAGDDYELLFTAPQERREAIEEGLLALGLSVSRLGHVEAEAGLRLLDEQGKTASIEGAGGYDHFAGDPP